MYAAGTKQNKYVDKFFDLLTNWFISICFYHGTFVSRNAHLYCIPVVHAQQTNKRTYEWMNQNDCLNDTI